jgi:hypothetical protein
MNKKFLIVIPVAFIVIIAAIVFSFSFINDNNNNNIPQSIVKSNDQDSNKEEGTTINSQILE